MSLPIYDSKDAIPEAQREDYAEHEGKWQHKTEIELSSERKKRAQLLSEKKEAEQQRKDIEKQLEELKRAQDAKEKGVTEEQLQKIRDDEAKARKPLEDKIAAIEAENRKLKLTDRVKAAALAKGVMQDRIDDAMLLLERRVDLDAEGKGIVVKDATGNVTAETIDDFLAKTFRTEKPYLYGGSGASGSGAEGGGGAGGAGYDPVAAGKEAAKAQSASREQNALAFR